MATFLFTLVFILLTLTGESVCDVSETVSSMWQSAHSAVRSLGDDAHSYLVSVLGKQTVDTLLQVRKTKSFSVFCPVSLGLPRTSSHMGK